MAEVGSLPATVEVDPVKLLVVVQDQQTLIAQLALVAEGLPRRVGWYRDPWHSGCDESSLRWHRAVEVWGDGHHKTACGKVGYIGPSDWKSRFRWELPDNPPQPVCEVCKEASDGP